VSIDYPAEVWVLAYPVEGQPGQVGTNGAQLMDVIDGIVHTSDSEDGTTLCWLTPPRGDNDLMTFSMIVSCPDCGAELMRQGGAILMPLEQARQIAEAIERIERPSRAERRARQRSLNKRAMKS
jgi:hypothetical protein